MLSIYFISNTLFFISSSHRIKYEEETRRLLKIALLHTFLEIESPGPKDTHLIFQLYSLTAFHQITFFKKKLQK